MDVLNQDLLISHLKEWGLSSTPEQLSALHTYASLLVEWNEKMNLTAITSPDGIAVLHFADSLSLLAALPFEPNASVLDIGTGAGFPAIPLKIFRPDLKLTMMDSLNKRLTFLKEVLGSLGLSAEILHARAEEFANKPNLRQQFDVVTARAVASLQVLAEYCLPYVKVGGVFAAMKGPSCSEELAAAKNAITTLGGQLEETRSFTLSDGSVRHIALIRKIEDTPEKYPRHGSKISKKPL